MDNLTESKQGSRLGDAVRKMCAYTLKTDYDMKLEVYKNDTATQPECSHSFTGSSKKCIVKAVAVAAAASLAICLISSLCSFFSRLLKN